MRSQILGRGVLLVGCALAAACPPLNGSSYDPQSADIPADAESAALALAVRVPQGSWVLQISAQGDFQIESADASTQGAQLEPECEESTCDRYRLHCPHGMCSFSFELALSRADSEPLALAAGFAFEEDRGHHGCGGPNPDYVPHDQREQLFEVSFELRAPQSAQDAAPQDAARGARD